MIALVVAGTLASVAAADDGECCEPAGSRLVSLPTDSLAPQGVVEFRVVHRALSAVRGSDAHSLYSLSGHQELGLGLSFTPIKNAEVSIYRTDQQDDYELALTYAGRVLRGRTSLGIALRVGVDDRREPYLISPEGAVRRDGQARVAGFAQLVVTLHLLAGRVELSAVPSYVSRTTTSTRVFNVPLHAAVALGRRWNLHAEYIPPHAPLEDSIAQWSIAVENVTGLHRFSIVIGNTTATAVDQYLAGDASAAARRTQRTYEHLFDYSFRNNDWHIGFNIVRLFPIGE